MRHRRLNRKPLHAALLASIAASLTAPIAGIGGEPLERLERIVGVGWGDGYHACADSGLRPGADLPPRSYAQSFGTAPNQRHIVATRHRHGTTFYDQFDAANTADRPASVLGDTPAQRVRIQDSQVILVQPNSVVTSESVGTSEATVSSKSESAPESVAPPMSEPADPTVARFFSARRADLPVKSYPDAEAALAMQNAAGGSQDISVASQDVSMANQDAAVASQADEHRKRPIRPQMVVATETTPPAVPSTRLVSPTQSIAPKAIALVHPEAETEQTGNSEADTIASASTTRPAPATRPDDWIPITRLAIPGRATSKPTVEPKPALTSEVAANETTVPAIETVTMPAAGVDSLPTRLISSSGTVSSQAVAAVAEPAQPIAPTLLPKADVPSSPRPARLGSSSRRVVDATLRSSQGDANNTSREVQPAGLQSNPFVSRPVVELAKRRSDADASIVRQPGSAVTNPYAAPTEVR